MNHLIGGDYTTEEESSRTSLALKVKSLKPQVLKIALSSA